VSVSELSISAKNLGFLAMPDACPRCFWLKTHFKLPYQIFPGIFSSIDSYSKKVTNLHHSARGHLPRWLNTMGYPIAVPGYSRFCVCHRETGVVLTGVPDEMIKNDDGLVILDYKTARLTGNQDALLPMYRCQLNGYALIADTLGHGPVIGLALVYYEPMTDIDRDDVAHPLLMDNGFRMEFESKILPIELDSELVPSLLGKARDIYELPKPPSALSRCKDCELLDELVNALSIGVDILST